MIGRRRAVSSNTQTVWFWETTEEVEVGKGVEERGREVADTGGWEDDTEAGRDEAETERVKGKEEAEENVVIVSEEG